MRRIDLCASPRARALLSLSALSAVFASACGVSLPDRRFIEDLRVLEIRAEPPETTLIEPGHDATTLLELFQLLQSAPNRTPVRLTATVAHPDLDATFDYAWKRCPPLQSLPCDDPLVEIRTATLAATSSVVTFSPVAELAGDIRSSTSAVAVFSSLTSDPRDLLDGLYANVILDTAVKRAKVPVDTTELLALKRLVIFDPLVVKVAILEARRAVASGMPLPSVAGVEVPTLCTKVDAAQLQVVFDFLEQRAPNRAPTYTFVELDPRETGSSTRALAAGEVLTLRPGQEIGLQGHALPDDKEEYQLIDDDCQLEKLHETLAWSWFTTEGELSKAITSEGVTAKNSAGEQVRYRAPLASELTADRTLVRIWSVLRDGRGGSETKIIDVVVVR